MQALLPSDGALHILTCLKVTEESSKMARVTVEDCVLKVPNRFELVLLAAQRAREITSGSPLSIDRDDDKNPVVALREIADETVGLEHLRTSVVRGMQKVKAVVLWHAHAFNFQRTRCLTAALA